MLNSLNLDEYMFSSNRIKEEEENITNQKMNKISHKINMPPIKENKSAFFIPKKRDTLFWCFYIALKGIDYFKLINNYFTEENTFKIKTIEDARKNKSLFKSNKIKVSIFESELLMEKNIKLDILKGLCLFYNLNIIIIRKKTYLEFLFDIKEPICLIEEYNNNSKTEYGIQTHITKEKYDEIKKKLFYLENPNKILNSISSYKLNELQNIAKKLNISLINAETSKNKNKKELYETIINNLQF